MIQAVRLIQRPPGSAITLANVTDAAPLLAQVLQTAHSNLVPRTDSDIVFRDERAPVETIVDSLVLRYLIQEGPSGLPGLGG